MKKKTISRVLNKKFKEFYESIEDEELRDLVKKNSIITGGSIASMLVNEPVNDYDVYFTDLETTRKVAAYFIEKFNKSHYIEAKVVVGKGSKEDGVYRGAYDDDRVWINLGGSGIAGTPQPGIAGETLDSDGEEEVEIAEEDETSEKYRPVFVSPNAITLSDKIQLIVRFYGTPDELHKNYDFAHCTNYWVSNSRQLILRPEALEALISKELVYIGSKYPVCSVIRTRKFIKRGFSITAGSYLKMILQCNELDLFNLDVLENQLVGVDSAYFIEVLSLVNEKDPEKINAAYLNEIIDRVF